MKPSTPSPSSKSSPTYPTNNSKSMNKLKKSNSSTKTKNRKSSGGQNSSSGGTSNSGNTTSSNHDNSSPNSSLKEKNNYQKTYVGFNAKSIKCIWEQYDTTETEISADVFPVLAEDASYKLWELANNLKTFTRHSGGKLTTDIVNEVLKDCNVPPVIGARAGNSEWNRVDYDGTFYFHVDEIIDLREEYRKDISSIQSGPLSLECSWLSNHRNLKEMNKLWTSIILAIMMGDETTFQYTIHTTLINPFIGCILPFLIRKSIEYLSFGCSDDALDRVVKFLKAVIHNVHSRDVTNKEEHFNLSNVLLCLLLGPIDIKTEMEHINNERQQQIKDEEARLTKVEEEERSKSGVKKIETNPFDADMEVDNEPLKYSFSQMHMNPIAFGIKQESSEDLRGYDFECPSSIKTEPNMYEMEFADRHEYDDSYFKCKKEEIAYNEDANLDTIPVDRLRDFDDEEKPENNEIFSPFEAEMCEDDRLVEEICALIGMLGSQWGFFEHEVVYLLTKRLEIFFHSVNEWSNGDFKQLQRFIQVLSSLGDAAFRELTIYFECIPVDELPEWILPFLNYAAIFLRGKKDYYFYEYISEVCGDGLNPFTLYYSRFVEKLGQRRVQEAKSNESNILRIPTKPQLKTAARTDLPTRKPSVDELFPDRSPRIPITRKIGFKFAGCCPVMVKSKNKTSGYQKMVQSSEMLKTFNTKIVVCQRKLFKQLIVNGTSDEQEFVDYRLLTI